MLAQALLRIPASPALLCSVLPASESFFFFFLQVIQFRLKTGTGQSDGDKL